MSNLKFKICIPLFNGGDVWIKSLKQLISYYGVESIVVIDSSSTDFSYEKTINEGVFCSQIDTLSFNHGATRNLAIELVGMDTDILVFMTQDAILCDEHSILNLLGPFDDPNVGAVCGRQIAHDDANPLAIHARIFNYPCESNIRSMADIEKYGLKSVFMSNSFSAYRKKALEDIGGFPSNTILCEDMFVAAKMLKKGYKLAYCGDAKVKHSHNYNLAHEFKRYFDIGVFHAMEPWIQEEFGGSSSEGLKYVISEIIWLSKHHKTWLLNAILHNFIKIIAMKLGLKYKSLPIYLTKCFSMHYRYWS